jgi:alpha-1,3/alpha-1,6-mannosyltransferase
MQHIHLVGPTQAATGAADSILVNSKFTAGVFGATFTRLQRAGVVPAVLYPAVAVPAEGELADAARAWAKELDSEIVEFIGAAPMFLSINRCVCVGWEAARQ